MKRKDNLWNEEKSKPPAQLSLDPAASARGSCATSRVRGWDDNGLAEEFMRLCGTGYGRGRGRQVGPRAVPSKEGAGAGHRQHPFHDFLPSGSGAHWSSIAFGITKESATSIF